MQLVQVSRVVCLSQHLYVIINWFGDNTKEGIKPKLTFEASEMEGVAEAIRDVL